MQARAVPFFLAALAAAGSPAAAQTPAGEVSPVTVVARTPLSAPTSGHSDAPQATFTLREDQLRTAQGSSLLTGLDERVPGVELSHAQGSPYQPSLFFRGFEASPLQGAAQGLAVYVDGVRFNQPFGDTVNWDLIPEAAIRSVTVEGANPAFGLNAVGGSVSVALKDGIDSTGGELEAAGGAFGLRRASVEAGGSRGRVAFYGAASATDEDGWRDFSPSRLRQVYGDARWRDGPLQLRLGLIGARNDLTGNGAAPVELLAADRSAVFTHPDQTRNGFAQATASFRYEPAGAWSVQGLAYASRLRQETANGDATDAEPCEDDPTLLCLDDDGPLLTDGQGRPIPHVLGDDPYAVLNATATRTSAAGASAQATWRAPLLGRPNALTVGGALDRSRTRFRATTSLGALTEDRGFGGEGVLIVQDDGPIAPVELKARTRYAGLYVVDVLQASTRLSVSFGGRWNLADLSLRDQLGHELDGDHRFERLNPFLGVTYAAGADLQAYAGLAATNRAPTAAELSCASPESPCSLTNFFVADPPLSQVKAHTFEAGLRGRADVGGADLAWTLGLFRTETRDDIVLAASSVRGRGYFRNVGQTLRQGLEAGLEARAGPVTAYAAYAYTDATFRSPLTLNSPDNPSASRRGLIEVEPGDRMPGVARQRLKLGLGYDAGRWRIAGGVVASSGRPLFGDEAGLEPELDGYVAAHVEAAVRITGSVELFAAVENLADARYETFGTFTATDEVELVEAPGADNPRTLSPAPPRSWLAGLRLRF